MKKASFLLAIAVIALQSCTKETQAPIAQANRAPTLAEMVAMTSHFSTEVSGTAIRRAHALSRREAEAMGNGNVNIIDYSHALSSSGFDGGGGDGKPRSATISQWFGFMGYNATITYIPNPDGTYTAKDAVAGLTGFNMAVTWEQATSVCHVTGDVIDFTITGYDKYNLLMEGLLQYWEQPEIIRGTYNPKTGEYHISKRPGKLSGVEEN